MTAELTGARARGEIIEPGGKKKKVLGPEGSRPRGYNLKGRGSRVVSGAGTPFETPSGSTRVTPEEEGEEGEEEGGEVKQVEANGKEVFTCERVVPLLSLDVITGLR